MGEVKGQDGCPAHPPRNAAEWLQADDYACRSFGGNRVSVYSKAHTADEVFVSLARSANATAAPSPKSMHFFQVNPTSQQLELWAGHVDLAREGTQNVEHKQLLWSRSVGQIERIATPQISCAGKESLISRKDGSILRSLCLDGFAAIVSKMPNEGASSRSVLLLSVSEGSLLHVQRLPSTALAVEHLLIDNNKIVFTYENAEARRTELSLLELFTEHRSINRLIALANRVGLGSASEDGDIHDGDIKSFHETFTLDVPLKKISSVSFTQTTQRVTPQALVLALPEAEKLYLIPHKVLTARRPLPPNLEELAGDGVSAGTAQDADTPPYEMSLPLLPWKFIPESLLGKQDLKISCQPGTLESMTLVTFPGTEVEPIPYYPALKYDSLSDDYSRFATIGTLAALFGFVFYSFRRLLTSKSPQWK
eukprot:Gregarina_sp_Pseudo_9__716@NODE_1457_length_1585_cov_16_005821_g1354_i0_p1_GENE_NODE_1457_length_1585_cov_16_005821_g1354_i0NODE_1457_length_1585_cov_16_005821_g1354_i0_p1_ORF_typecomplete_len432_score93_85EMC1_C/PF07774_13/6e03EMC1_C/PF07774_13/2_3e23_NODE_1457_length_1585_cov_16_005821_g1354_i02881556